jgi:hypothetical protein
MNLQQGDFADQLSFKLLLLLPKHFARQKQSDGISGQI